MIWVPGGGVAPAIPNAPRGRPVAIHPWKVLQDEGAKVIEASLRSVVGLGADTVADDALFRSRVIDVAWDLLPTPVRLLGRRRLRWDALFFALRATVLDATGGEVRLKADLRGGIASGSEGRSGGRPRVRSTSPDPPQPPPRPRPRRGTPSPPGRRPPSGSTSARRSPSSPTSTRPDAPGRSPTPRGTRPPPAWSSSTATRRWWARRRRSRPPWSRIGSPSSPSGTWEAPPFPGPSTARATRPRSSSRWSWPSSSVTARTASAPSARPWSPSRPTSTSPDAGRRSDAGRLAGLEVLDIINEPTAAAIAFGVQHGFLTAKGESKQAETILVYDLGGGTFDATLMAIDGRDYRALATAGDVFLGGIDWDRRIVDLLAEEFKAKHRGLDPRDHPGGLQRLMAEAEDAKRALSARERVIIVYRACRAGYPGRAVARSLRGDDRGPAGADAVHRVAIAPRGGPRLGGPDPHPPGGRIDADADGRADAGAGVGTQGGPIALGRRVRRPRGGDLRRTAAGPRRDGPARHARAGT